MRTNDPHNRCIFDSWNRNICTFAWFSSGARIIASMPVPFRAATVSLAANKTSTLQQNDQDQHLQERFLI